MAYPSLASFPGTQEPINAGKEPPFSLMIARFPGNNSEHPASSGWVTKTALDIARSPLIDTMVPHRLSSTPITMCRNRTVWNAIKSGCDYLLMIDSDMEPDCCPGAPGFWDTAWGFMSQRRAREHRDMHDSQILDLDDEEFFDRWWQMYAPATIAAPYCGPSPGQDVCVLEWKGTKNSDNADNRFKIGLINRHNAAQRTGIGRCAALPTGLILYDVRTFFYLPVPWFDYEYVDDYHIQIISTEDVYQTRNAGLLGMPQFCAWDCWAGHWKPELVTKPEPITCDIVNDTLRDAIVANVTSRRKVHFVHQDDPNGSPVVIPAH